MQPGESMNSPQIAKILGVPVENVARNWPLVATALNEQGIGSPLVQIAALATIGTEVPKFLPICEYGPDIYFQRYELKVNLGNLTPGDGLKFKGRGFIQITGRANYERYGKVLGIDLLGLPGLALEPETAARILALYFKTMKVNRAAEAQDWSKVRKLVNGGLNGWDRFHGLVQKLLEVPRA